MNNAPVHAIALFGLVAPAAAQCQPLWATEFGGSHVWGPRSLISFDDGSGTALYLGAQQSSLFRWKETGWVRLDPPLSSTTGHYIWDMVIFDDGNGPAIYAAVSTPATSPPAQNAVRRWTGSDWEQIGVAQYGYIYCLEVFDDGAGTQLYAGGRFPSMSGIPANSLARWNGQTWSDVEGGLRFAQNNAYGNVYALEVHDEGAGSGLYVGGSFGVAGSISASSIARYDSAGWSALGSGAAQPVLTLLSASESGMPALYVGGPLQEAGGVPVTGVARWAQQSWSRAGGNMPSGADIRAMAFYDDGSGARLFAGGDIPAAGHLVVRENGEWQSFSPGLSAGVRLLRTVDLGQGPKLWVGGPFYSNASTPAWGLLQWDGQHWAAPSPGGVAGDVVKTIRSAAPFQELYISGTFTGVAGQFLFHSAMLSGSAWTSPPQFGDIIAHNDAGVPTLFRTHLQASQTHISRQLATQWVSTGAFDYSLMFDVATIQGKEHLFASHHPWYPIHVYNAGAWTSIGTHGGSTNMHRAAARVGAVDCLVVAAGTKVAAWNGTDWLPLPPAPAIVTAMAGHDDGSGPSLFIATSEQVYRFDGQAWIPLGSPLAHPVFAMVSFDDGRGPQLYAALAASFTNDGSLARWDGSAWQQIQADGRVQTLAVENRGHSRSLWIGGTFYSVDGIPSSRIARLDACACYANCDGSSQQPTLNAADFACFLQRFAAGDPWANCDGSTQPPLLNIADFACFLNKFAQGCQ